MRVDVAFRAAEGPVPLDHGYALFGALCRILGDLHGADWLAVHPLRGILLTGDEMALATKTPALQLRVTPDSIPTVFPLAGRTLDVAGAKVHVGVSSVRVLRPSPALQSRQVTIKGYTEEEPFRDRIDVALASMNIEGQQALERRRVVSIDGRVVVGFGLAIRGLSEADSLHLQYVGLGGRRRFGCGVFHPVVQPCDS
ncbi:MAG: type I-MYXAN CRISPR-associated protein Cas6/Cmx6 [Myxococcales bacterium]